MLSKPGGRGNKELTGIFGYISSSGPAWTLFSKTQERRTKTLVWLLRISLCCSGWPETPRDLPAPVSQILGFKMCTTKLPLNNSFFKVPMDTFYCSFPLERTGGSSLYIYNCTYVSKSPGIIGIFCWSRQWRLGTGVVMAIWPQLSSGKVAEQAWWSLHTV